MPGAHRCPYCQTSKKTRAAVNRHVSQKSACHEKWRHSLGVSVGVAREESEGPEDHEPPAEPEEHEPPADSIPSRSPSPAFFSHELSEEDEEIDDEIEGFVLPARDPPAEPTPDPAPRSRRATVEEVPDEDDPQNFRRFVELFPGEEKFPDHEKFVDASAETFGKGETVFERLKAEQAEAGLSRHAPFLDGDEWELASWLSKNVSQMATDAYLKLPIVSLMFAAASAIIHLLHRPNAALKSHIITTTRTCRRSINCRQVQGGNVKS